jgi:DNA-binding FadR family transcriptional regulator
MSGTAVPRAHVADHVFEALARSILVGELAVGQPTPPERVLVERFGVSRIIVRQALHRLAELGLVRVKQGGATVVLDPRESTDLRVLGLLYRVSKGALPAADVRDIIEKQYLQGLSVVEVAARKARRVDLAGVVAVVDEAARDAAKLSDFAAFEERFWSALAAAGGNRIFKMELAWWYATLADRPVPAEVLAADTATRFAFYRELLRRLVAGDAPVEYYLAAVRPLLELVVARGDAS